MNYIVLLDIFYRVLIHLKCITHGKKVLNDHIYYIQNTLIINIYL